MKYFKLIEVLADSLQSSNNLNVIYDLIPFANRRFNLTTDSLQKAYRGVNMRLGAKFNNKIGDFQMALAFYLNANQFVKNKENLDEWAWYVENEIANIYVRKGDYEHAQYFYSKVERSLIFYNKDEFLSRFYTNFGILFLSIHDFTKAETYFLKGLKLAQKINYKKGQIANEIELANLYMLQDKLTQSNKYCQMALVKIDQKAYEKKSKILSILSLINTKEKKYKQSLDLINQSISALDSFYLTDNRREFAKLNFVKAQIYFNKGDNDQALFAIYDGLYRLGFKFCDIDQISFDDIYGENSFVDLFVLWSKIENSNFHKYGDLKYKRRQIKGIELALYANDKLRNNILSNPSLLISVSQNKTLINELIEAIYLIAESDKDFTLNAFAMARLYFNKSKALIYLNESKKNELFEKVSVQDKEQLAKLEIKIFDSYNQKHLNNFDFNEKLVAFQKAKEMIFSKYSFNTNSLSNDINNYIEYLVTDNHLYSLSSINGQNKFLKLIKTDSLFTLINCVRSNLEKRSSDRYCFRMGYETLILPITSRLPNSVCIIPDGVLNLLPFEVLIDRDNQYLIENVKMHYKLAYDSNKKKKDSNFKYNICALNPVYPKNQLLPLDYSVNRSGLYFLKHSRSEVNEICKIVKNNIILENLITKKEIIKKVKESEIFHFSGHAVVTTAESFLYINKDEKLSADEIRMLNVNSSLIVLSACETGLGKLEKGEGIKSLSKTFLTAGANATVHSLWKVDDEATKPIMIEFYKEISKKRKIDDALRNAKMKFFKNAGAEKRHPYYWAGFISSGSMEPLLTSISDYHTTIILILYFIFIIFSFKQIVI